tara:strand:- start:4110 stop:4997 length:888 start_codon:yes stop_codon:yes gene_type:complete
MKKIFKIILYIIVILALAVCLFFLIDTLQEKNKEVSNTEIKDNFTDNNNLYPHYRAIVKTESKKESSEIVDKKLVGNVSSESNHTAHHIILFFSLILSLVCVIITYLVYRWKRILIEGKPNALVPEEWKKSLDDYKSALIGLKDVIITLQKSNQEQKEISMAMQKNMDEKDELIDRYRKGYDSKIIKKFIERFLRVKIITEELKKENKLTKDDIVNIDELLQDAIEDCDIETFSPPLGSDYRKMGSAVSDKVIVEKTTDESKNFQIIDIVKRGYKFRGEDGEIIRPSQVKILKYN